MRLHVLGELRLIDAAGAQVELKSRKCRALLAYLALHPRRGDTRERLAALLWGEMGDERARANLRQSVSALREVVGDQLVSTDGAVHLEGPLADCDAAQVLRLAASSAPEDWEQAAKLATGELLQDLAVDEEPFEEWLLEQRRSFTQAVSSLWSKLARHRRTAGDSDGVEGALSCWLALEPTAEEAHRALMELYAASGRRAKALEQFSRCASVLERLLSAKPDAATVALQQQISASAPQRATLPLATKPSVAVVPFVADEAWLGDGFAEDIVTALSKFDRLLVISRQSSFVFREAEVDVRELRRVLGVHYVLSGSLRRTPERLKVSVQLADSETGAAVWAHKYDVPGGDLSVLENEVVQVVVATLAGRVEADQLARACRGRANVGEAYDLLLKAKAHHHRFTAADNATARQCLERAVTLDPELASAHAWFACVLSQSQAFTSDKDVLPRAFEHVLRAAQLDEGDSECHRILAAYYIVVKRHDDAARHQARALALNPNDDRIVCQQGELLTFLGQPAEALPWIEKAIRLNPFHGDGFFHDHARALYHLKRHSEARKALLSIRLPRLTHRVYLAACCNALGDKAQAAMHLAEAGRLSPGLDVEAFVRNLSYAAPPLVDELLRDVRP